MKPFGIKIFSYLTTSNRLLSTGSVGPGAHGVYDLLVVGGGIVGCATAREMKNRHPQMRIAIVEKEDDLAKHQTGHNSGVIHAGIYYKPGSMKAKLCVEGLHMSYDYMDKKNIPYKKIGKLIVAHTPKQLANISVLHERSIANNCPDVQVVDKEGIKNFAPRCKGEKAIWSPWTGICDWGEVCKSFADDFQQMGGDIFLNFEVKGFAESAESKGKEEHVPICVYSSNKYINTKYVLTCAGLQSDRLAIMTGCGKDPQIVPFRGEYLLLSSSKQDLVPTNIYPVPDPRFPFLGVHFTPRMNGDIWLGPNAVLSFAREGYSWKDINLNDCLEMAKFKGLWKLSFKYIVPGMEEVLKSAIPRLSVKELNKYISEITPKDIMRGPAGVRAQALDMSGELVDDFVFDNGQKSIGKRVIHCRNAPSPGATSSMAIAKFISEKLESDFQF